MHYFFRTLISPKKLFFYCLVNIFINLIVILINYNLSTLISNNKSMIVLFFSQYCLYNTGIVEVAIFVSLISFFLFQGLNTINLDNCKYGIFILSRTSRKEYIFKRTLSILIAIGLLLLLSFIQTIMIHLILNLEIDFHYYLIFFVNTYIRSCTIIFISLMFYNRFRFGAIPFIFGFISSFLLFSYDYEKSIYVIPFGIITIFLVVLLFCFYLSTTKSDFITTKIKE